MFRVYFVSETAQVELKCGRVKAPAGVQEGAVDHLLEVRLAVHSAGHQGLTLVHFSTQLEQLLDTFM
jgi:hypothetical protein